MTTSDKKILQPDTLFLHQLFQNTDSKKEFVISKYTYEEIYQLAAGISKSLSSLPEDERIVCLATEDKGFTAAAVLASLMADLILVLPYAYSEQVLKELHEETGFNRAIGDKTAHLPSGVEIITPSVVTQPSSVINADIKIDPDKVFLKLFTGGSTGKSKIWSKTFRNLFGEALYLSEKFNVSDKDKIIATVPPYHIYGLLFSVLLPFVSSASVMPDMYVFPKEIISVIKTASPTILISIPIHYKALNQSGMNKDSCLRLAFSSAAPLDKSESIAFYKQAGISITEIYGSTETGGIATRHQAMGEASFEPFDNIVWKIKDEHLCIRSDFVSPVSGKREGADGFFTTGDRVSYHHPNRFVLMGRSDDIVKIAGKRVDLKEIQHKIMQISGVRNVVVSSVPGAKGRDNEIAAVIESNLDESEIRAFASKRLEPYAIPRHIRIVGQIQFSSTGKVRIEDL